MSDSREGPFPLDRERLEALPQRFDVWQLDARQSAALPTGDRPWVTAVVSRTDDHLLALEFSHHEPTAAQAWQILVKALQEPVAGEPHRPTEIQLRRHDWTDTWSSRLDALNIICVTVETLDQLDGVLEDLAGRSPEPDQPGLLDMPSVTPESVASFFDAAATFYQQAPWDKTGDRPIQVECSKLEGGPRNAVVMGASGVTRGLVLYDDLETVHRIQQGDLPGDEIARRTAALAVVFGPKGDLTAVDIEAIERHGWRVAGPDAYPWAYRMEPGLAMRPPLAWELEVLEACLRTVPEFVRKKTRRLAPLAITVLVASGDLPLVLSWATG